MTLPRHEGSPDLLAITDVHLTPGSARDRATGLLGYIRCQLAGGLLLDGIALRRTADGRRALAFPMRRDAAGTTHTYFAPVDAETRAWIEAQIFAAVDRGQPEAE